MAPGHGHVAQGDVTGGRPTDQEILVGARPVEREQERCGLGILTRGDLVDHSAHGQAGCGEGGRSRTAAAAPEGEIADHATRFDESWPEQQAQTVGEGLLAEQPLGEPHLQDSRQPLA
jgi:hypothetical protein